MAFLSNTHRPTRHAPALRVSFRDIMSIYRQRRALARLDDHDLKDLGLTREEAEIESRRPFWDIPD